MNMNVIRAMLKKDISLFVANRFYLLMTIVAFVLYIVMYFILPQSVDEKLKLAMYAPVVPLAFEQLTNQPGADIQFYNSEDEVKEAVLTDDYHAGIVMPSNVMEIWSNGGIPRVVVYYPSASPPEVADAIGVLVKELAYAQTGQALAFDTTQEVLGPDMLGAQLSLRDRIKPVIAAFILLFEIMSLASLISVEIEQGTVRALLVTPVKTSDLFLAKGVLGVGLAFIQAILFMALVGGFNHQPLIILVTLLIGSVMVVGTGFLLASLARDVNGVTGWGTLVFILLMIPGIGSVIPGLISDWAKLIPSYYLTDTFSRVINYGANWGDIAVNLLVLTGFTAVVLLVGMMTLGRRYR